MISARIKSAVAKRLGKYLEKLEMRSLALNFKERYGYLGSFTSKLPVDNYGKPIPWFTYPAIEILESLDLSHSRVFEWGSGNSSAFFSSRCHSVESIESDEAWYDYQKSILKENQKITFIPRSSEDYPAAINSAMNDKYDIIVVDGMQRLSCARYACSRLASGGILILDNSDWYPALCSSIRGLGFCQIDFHGHGPINPYTWTTSFFLLANQSDSSIVLLNKRKTGSFYSAAALEKIAVDDGSFS